MTDEENRKNQENITDVIAGLFSVTAPVPEHWNDEMISLMANNLDRTINALYTATVKLADLTNAHNRLHEIVMTMAQNSGAELDALHLRVRDLENRNLGA